MEEQKIEEQEVNSQDGVDVALDDVVKEEVAQAEQSNDANSNMVRLREAKERAEREKESLQERLKEYESYRNNSAKKESADSYGDEELIEGKHLKKEMALIRGQLDEARLKNVYSDFDKVVNQKTIQRLRELDPESAETIANSQASIYSRGAAVYKRIKELGAYVEDVHQADRQKAQENIAKPRPLNSVSPQQGDSPLSMANAFSNGLTPELKKQLWKEVQDAAKRH